MRGTFFTLFFVGVFLFFGWGFVVSPASAAACQVFGPGSSLPTGFGAPYDTAGKSQTILLGADCENLRVTLGARSPFVYKKGYFWQSNAWREFEFDCRRSLGDWCLDAASKTFSVSDIGREGFFIAYTCRRDGSTWLCGCRDNSCTASYWQLQKFLSSEANIATSSAENERLGQENSSSVDTAETPVSETTTQVVSTDQSTATEQMSPATDDNANVGSVGATEASQEGTVLRTYVATDENFDNPERGFFTQEIFPETNLSDAQFAIIRPQVRLDDFRNRPLSEEFLNRVQASFDAVRDSGKKVVVRFQYAAEGPDAPKDIIMRHIEQITPLLRRNADVIFALEAGFIGMWGEWHSSANGLDNMRDRTDIMKALLAALPRNRMVTIRYPLYKQYIFNRSEPTPAAEAFGKTDYARVGHTNDCFLVNEHDAGTYLQESRDGRLGGYNPAIKEYVARDTRFVPMGGETCGMHERTACDNAVAEMEKLHWTFLNYDYHKGVIERWKREGCFDQIARRLGYRFELIESRFPQTLNAGEVMNFHLKLRNVGFASLFNPRPVVLVLDGPANYRVNLPIDPRWWAPGEESTITARLMLPAGMPAGEYTLALWMPDAFESLRNRPEYAVRFANRNVWDAKKGYNKLGTLRINGTGTGGGELRVLSVSGPGANK